MKDFFSEEHCTIIFFMINKVYSPNSYQIACFTLLKSLCIHLERLKEKRRTVVIEMVHQEKARAAKPDCLSAAPTGGREN